RRHVPRPKVMSAEERERLRALFDAYDTDQSGSIERDEFFTICTELQVSPSEAERLFNRLDVDKDGTITLPEFISGFHERHRMDVEQEPRQEEDDEEPCAVAWEDFAARLGEQSKFIPKHDLVATLYQNVSVNEPRLVPQLEKVLLGFIKEIKQQNGEMENLALAIRRAQDQASMQLSEMEEEMDQRIHTTERKTREQRGSLVMIFRWFLSNLNHAKHRAQIEEKYKNITVKDESPALKKKISELTLENQRFKQELLKSQTKVACLQSDMDSLKTELTDQSINFERDEELMKQFSEERDILESQIEILQEANRKLHDSNDGLRAALERTTKVGKKVYHYTIGRLLLSRSEYFARMCVRRPDDFSIYGRRPSSDSLALALCDPGLKRRNSSECEEDSLPEIYMDSGLSTLRGSHGGYDSEQEVKGLEEEEEQEEEEEEEAEEVTKKREEFVAKSLTEETSDTEKAYRIVMAGDAAVGKSSFLLRLCKNEFKLNSNATLGVDFQMKTFMVDGEPTLLQIWDTAGQERFRSIAKSYFRRADGVLLLYDVTCERSFLNVREWVDMIEDISQEDIPIMLVGNKCDLRQGAANCVPTSYGEKLAMTYNTLFCETSAKDGSNILEAVLHLARELTKHAKLDQTAHYQSLPNLDAPRKKPNFSCCN
uniref:RAS and EF-hand domain containing n=1 Tax=Hippocampus comes TaxID=109280 RepID=A0A3Q2Z9T6_HIPCM